MWKFLKTFIKKVLRKWWVWLLLLIWDVFKDRIHGLINEQIDLHGKAIMVFIEKLFNIPLGIGGMLNPTKLTGESHLS